MKKILLMFAFALVARGLCFGTTIIAPKAMEVLGTVELLDVIKPGAVRLAPGAYRLSREWVGTLVPLFEDKQPNAPQTAVLPKQPEPLRFNCLMVAPDGAVRIEAVRFDEAGRALSHGFLSFKLTRQMHSLEEILQTGELVTLKSWFGRSRWDGGISREYEWLGHWMLFSPTQNETLVCQDISAHSIEKRKIANVADSSRKVISDEESHKVKITAFAEGVFRPANPDCEEDRRMYPSENEKYLARPETGMGGKAWRAQQDARIAKHPEPLRSFAKAFHTPGDPGLHPGEAAINRFREKPDPLLIRQLVERLGNRDYDMPVFLQRLIGEDAGKYFPNIVPWKPGSKKIAVEALLDALPEAPRYAAAGVIVMILAETSLVTLRMDTPEFSINATVFRRTPPASGGYGYSARFEIKDGAERTVVLNRIASELRSRWEASGFCVERHSAPASVK